MHHDHLLRALKEEFGALAHSGRLRVISTQTKQTKNNGEARPKADLAAPKPTSMQQSTSARARGEIVEDHPAPTGVAAQILKAGAKARGERI